MLKIIFVICLKNYTQLNWYCSKVKSNENKLLLYKKFQKTGVKTMFN